ncbi:hypothetical protein [Saccharopolyspora sp. ASAGF58]|uniref:hypothetical protein n=1 Tax=Saccharopolyspora sp. ASAGF58 TaxID=2719023 RepID=UPI00143FC416|nr:hypothetical protein [Saccharopolyspora sp. ASAGF58]QIZ37027.1 hypothetical protein FDZ84_23240 [Saccharopolyspora sp. ASAGF58]
MKAANPPPRPTPPVSAKSYWWAAVPDVDPDEVHRKVRLLNGFEAWPSPEKDGTRYQLAHSTLEIRSDTTGQWLLIVDRTDLAVQSTAVRLDLTDVVALYEPARAR